MFLLLVTSMAVSTLSISPSHKKIKEVSIKFAARLAHLDSNCTYVNNMQVIITHLTLKALN